MQASKRLAKVRSFSGVTEYRLPNNGLQVLHRFDPTLPLVAVCVTYRVGSRNEAEGHTGSTHLLEHLLFKDSDRFNKANGKAITGYLEWLGAAMNATTWFDRTNYFELLPKEHAGEALALEADRMRRSRFTDADLATEMPIVRNEYEIGRNDPFELLDEALMAKAFSKHPYRIPTIGSKEDIEAADEKKLREFYDVFYWPNNATLAVFGDIKKGELERLVAKEFAAIPPSPKPIPQMKATEPRQKKARSVRMKKDGDISIAMLAYKIPNARHPDFPALVLLADILGGGFASRFERALVDTGLAAEVSVSPLPLYDPGILTMAVHLAPETKAAAVLSKMRRINQAVGENIEAAELARAKERILAESGFARDGIFSDIRTLSESVAAGDWTLGYRLEPALKRLTPKDISRVARRYLVAAGETSGVLTAA